ncbi:MAG TPA: GTP-binding protein [Chitinophagaceae bacterium]|jgi:G3E family GTPase
MKLCLIGGFLGSGKTTAITTAAILLKSEHKSVAVITNDQGEQLVDTALTNSLDIPNKEVLNGCFCCNYSQFYQAIRDLDVSLHPDFIFAEAVGSCADLVATIVKPLLRSHAGADVYLSVFADGPVLLSLFEGQSSFINESIRYIYRKQLEEAGILIVNKSDLLREGEIQKIRSVLAREFPGKEILFQQSREEASVRQWLDALNENGSNGRFKSLEIDYQKYADGEAALGWLDAYLVIHSKGKAIGKSLEFINELSGSISNHRFAIGHLKFFLESGEWKKKISFPGDDINSNELLSGQMLKEKTTIIVNGRAEAGPDQLKQLFFQSIRKIEGENCHVEVLHLASFQPGYPRPTYRLAE